MQTRQQEAIRTVHDTICSDVGPTIAALVEQLDSATPAWAALNGLLGKLSSSKEVLEGACPPRDGTQAFDIGDDAEHGEDASVWSEGQDLRESGADDAGGGGASRGVDMRCDDDGGTADHNWGGGEYRNTSMDYSMGTGDWWDSPPRRWQAGARWQVQGHGQWHRASWADQMEEEQQDRGGDDYQPAASRRRVGPADAPRADSDGHRGQQQQQQQQQQPLQQVQPQQRSHGEATGGGAAVHDPEEQRRLHGERVSRIVNAAIDAGVNPVSPNGEDLHLLDPNQLSAWVAENLPAAMQS